MVYGGTAIMQHDEMGGRGGGGGGGKEPICEGIPRAPDGGCVALVLRTGFETSQVSP